MQSHMKETLDLSLLRFEKFDGDYETDETTYMYISGFLYKNKLKKILGIAEPIN